jgi:ferric-dicitrate binding protein FerR (iron transport regulator)
MKEDYKLAKWLTDELTAEELAEFKQNPDYPLYEKIKEASARLQTPAFDENKILKEVLSAKEETKVVPLKANWFFRIAAIIVICFGLFFAYQNNNNTHIKPSDIVQNVVLPDNSEVALNRNAEIKFQKWFWDNNRNISLKGEAYFKVAKGKTFEVSTELGKVTVLGTQFNVNSKDNTFQVTCYEGKVKVNYKNEELLLTKGMLVTFEKDIKTEGVTTSIKPAWTLKKTEMSFSEQSLQNVISEIESTYGISIKANSIKTAQLFTGKLPTQNLDVALKIIASTYHLQIINVKENHFELVKE